MVDACKRASTRQSTAVPLFGYAREDEKPQGESSCKTDCKFTRKSS